MSPMTDTVMSDPATAKEDTTQDMGSNVPVHITRLAPELILRIFGMLNTGESTCLGVTCRRFYTVLKDLYPEPICLRTPMVQIGKGRGYRLESWRFTDLYHVLANWVGPRYRMGLQINVKLHYYNKEVYSDSGEYAYISQNPEWRSDARHQDYHIAQSLYDKNYRPDRALPNPLPNPFNKGNAWNAEAITSIKASISQFKSTKDWKQFWKAINLFYHNHEHFDRFEDEYMWGMWSDGLKLMDF